MAAVSTVFDRNASPLLFVAGLVMVLLAVLVEDREAVAITLLVLGTSSMGVAVLLPRLVGHLKFGAQGFEAELVAAVEQEALEVGLSPEETEAVIEQAKSDVETALVRWTSSLVQEQASADSERPGAELRRLAREYVVGQREGS